MVVVFFWLTGLGGSQLSGGRGIVSYPANLLAQDWMVTSLDQSDSSGTNLIKPFLLQQTSP